MAAVRSAKVTYIIHTRPTEISNICVFSLPLQITDRTESLNRSIKKRYLQGCCGISVKGAPCFKLLKLSHLPEASGYCLILFSLVSSNSIKKSQPPLPVSKIDDRLEQYTQAIEVSCCAICPHALLSSICRVLLSYHGS